MTEIDSTLQQTAQDIHALRQQIASIHAQVREFESTVEALKAQAADKAVYQQVGAVLLEVSDRGELLDKLKNSIQTLSEHLMRLEAKETDLRKAYEELVERLGESA